MANQTGQKDQALITGRIAYGYDGTNAYPFKVDASGQLLLPASTVTIGALAASTANIGDVDVICTKTIQTELLAITSIAASTQQASSTLALTGIKKAAFFIDHGRAATTAFGTNGTEYRIEVSQKAAGNDTWRPVASVLADATAAALCTASTAVAAGTSVITSGTTGVASGDIIFWANTAAASSSEWSKVVAVVSNTSVTVLDAFTHAHVATEAIYNKAEHFVVVMDAEPFTRARVIVNNNASGTTLGIYTRVACITEV